MKSAIIASVCSISLMASYGASFAHGAILTSDQFIRVYGATVLDLDNAWSATEATTANTATTIGDFSFVVAPIGGTFSGTGPTVVPTGGLSNGGPGKVVGSVGPADVGQPSFLVTVTGSYNGPAPIDAAANPNYQLTLRINELSIEGLTADHDSAGIGHTTLGWRETTVGNEQLSPEIALDSFNVTSSQAAFGVRTNYNLLQWFNANDHTVALGSLNDPITRTFDLGEFISPWDGRSIDGLIVIGDVVVTYDTQVAVPEPSSITLMGLALVGGVVLMRKRIRRSGKPFAPSDEVAGAL